jgi:hypothetical protein
MDATSFHIKIPSQGSSKVSCLRHLKSWQEYDEMLKIEEFLRDSLANHIFMTSKEGVTTSVSINKDPRDGLSQFRTLGRMLEEISTKTLQVMLLTLRAPTIARIHDSMSMVIRVVSKSLFSDKNSIFQGMQQATIVIQSLLQLDESLICEHLSR